MVKGQFNLLVIHLKARVVHHGCQELSLLDALVVVQVHCLEDVLDLLHLVIALFFQTIHYFLLGQHSIAILVHFFKCTFQFFEFNL